MAEDPDGDELTVYIDYSPDGGTIWWTIESVISNTGLYDWSTHLNANSQIGLLRIIVFDGFEYHSDFSKETFEVLNDRSLV